MTLKTQAKVINANMAQLLTERRKGQGMNMQALANDLKKPHSFIAKIEKQRRRLDVGEFIYYCQAMDQDPVEMLEKLLASES
jgi:transcriptional regulator with XRE-family HTH domain